MVALRIVLILVAVVLLNFAVLVLVSGDPDEGWWGVWRALNAQHDHPTTENQRALEAAQQEYEDAQRPKRIIILSCFVLITAGGVFLIIREFKRRRTHAHPIAGSTI
jgi:flagellar basal body-associated protein FliL